MSDQPTLAQIYTFLAQASRYPEPEWFTDDFFTAYRNLLSQLQWPDAENFPETATSSFIESVQVEYTRLFINAVPHVIAPPYGSYYIDGTLNGPWTERTLTHYQKHGFRLTNNEFADHLVTELDFLGLREKEEPGGSDHFLTTLFRPWFEPFAQQVLDNCGNDYIATTIKLIDFFTAPESEGA